LEMIARAGPDDAFFALAVPRADLLVRGVIEHLAIGRKAQVGAEWHEGERIDLQLGDLSRIDVDERRAPARVRECGLLAVGGARQADGVAGAVEDAYLRLPLQIPEFDVLFVS